MRVPRDDYACARVAHTPASQLVCVWRTWARLRRQMAELDVTTVCTAIDELGAGAHGVAAIRRKLAVSTGAKLPSGAWNDEVIRLLRDAVDAGSLEKLGSRATFLCAFEATGAVPTTLPSAGKNKAKGKKTAAKRKSPAALRQDSGEDDSDDEPLVSPPPAKKAKKSKKQTVSKTRKRKNPTAPPSTAESAPTCANSTADATAAGFSPRWFWAGDKSGGMQNKWVEFDDAVRARLEQQWNKPRPAGKLRGQLATDSERFVDLDAMLQARKDNPTRVRGVVRIASLDELAQA